MAAQILPLVKLFVVCEDVIFDAGRAGYVLHVPLHNVALPDTAGFPFEWDQLDCYAQLAGGAGTFRFAVEVLSESADVVLYRTKPAELTFPPLSRLMVSERRFRLRDVRLPRPDVYRVRLLCNHKPLDGGEAALRVLGGVPT